jgi:hypothetical protein
VEATPKSRLLKTLPIDLPMTARPLALVTLKNRTINPLAHLFAEHVRAAAGPLASKTLGADRTMSLVAGLTVLTKRRGLQKYRTSREAHRFSLPSFNACFGPFERGGPLTGQAYLTLPQSVSDSVCEEAQRCLSDSGGPVEIEVEFQFASGQRG